MKKEYNPSIGKTIFYGLMALSMFVFAIYLLTIYRPGVPFFVMFLALTLATGAILIVVSLYRRKVIISKSDIVCVSLFSTRRLDFSTIRGCRVNGRIIRLEPLSENDRVILIRNFTDFGNWTELEKWIKSRFTDLDAADLSLHRQELAKNTRLGATEADRQKYLERSKSIAITYNIWGAVTSIPFLFVKGAIASVLLMAWPVLGIVIILSVRGTIKFVSSSTVSAYPFIMLGFTLPCAMTLFKSFIEFSLLQTGPLWLPAGAISGVFFVLLYIPGINPSVHPVRAQIIVMLTSALLFGFGSARLINCALDPHLPSVYSATVLNREIQTGRSNTYLLDLSPWGPREAERNVEVERDFYHTVSEGDTINVILRPGLLHIPWFTVSKPTAHSHTPPSSAPYAH